MLYEILYSDIFIQREFNYFTAATGALLKTTGPISVEFAHYNEDQLGLLLEAI